MKRTKEKRAKAAKGASNGDLSGAAIEADPEALRTRCETGDGHAILRAIRVCGRHRLVQPSAEDGHR